MKISVKPTEYNSNSPFNNFQEPNIEVFKILNNKVLTPNTTWDEIQAIEQGGLPQEYNKVEDLFELPLQKAGQKLWDLGITTKMSSANKNQEEAYITIDYDKLNDINKKIIKKNGIEVYRQNHSFIPYNEVKIGFNIGNLSPWEVQNKIINLIKQFKSNKTFKIIKRSKKFRIIK